MRILSVFTLLIIVACSNPDFKTIDEDYSMKLTEFGEKERKIEPPCYVQFQWKLLDQNDSALFNERLFIRVDSIYPIHGITESLSLLNEEEAALFTINNENIELEFDEMIRNEKVALSEEGVQTHYLKVEKIYMETEFEHERDKFIEWISAQHELDESTIEDEIISNFITSNFTSDFTKSPSKSGLNYQLFPSNSGLKTSYGKQIKIHYKGGVLGHPEQHSSVKQDFRIGEEMQVIRAIEEMLLYMEQGDSAVIIAPSKIAFGEFGSSTGIIPPASPVYYEIVLDSVKGD